MKSSNYGLYTLALAVLVVGVLWVGVPGGSLAFLGLIVLCPLMMFFMMRGMGGGGHGDTRGSDSTERTDSPDHTNH